MINKNVLFTTCIFLFALGFGGWLSVCLGKELCWDLANYHYYNPYVFFHPRPDIWPVTYIHQYLNPTIDFLSYFLIHDLAPRPAVFILGAIHGINFWIIFLIAKNFIATPSKLLDYLLAFILAVLGIYGPTVLPGIGSFQNDDLITIFILSFLFLQIKAIKNYETAPFYANKLLFLSGFLLGAGIGLKLTAGLFLIGAMITTILLPIPLKCRIEFMMRWCTAVILGILLTSGYWMYLMWQQHHNPLFPFFNDIFHSPDFPNIHWRDERFLPQGLWQSLFYPFYFSWHGTISDSHFRDVRFILTHVLFIGVGLYWLMSKLFSSFKKIQLDLPTFYILIFYMISYIIWQSYFAIARYISALEMLAPLTIYVLISTIPMRFSLRFVTLYSAYYILVMLMIPIPLVRAQWYDSDFFNIKFPSLVSQTPQATVLIACHRLVLDKDPVPQNYLIPFFPHHWHFIGVPFWQGKYFPDICIANAIKSSVHHKEKIFLLTSDVSMPALYQAAQQMGLRAAGPCQKIFSDRQKMSNQDVLLCPVT